jgi:hypothetical protein
MVVLFAIMHGLLTTGTIWGTFWFLLEWSQYLRGGSAHRLSSRNFWAGC